MSNANSLVDRPAATGNEPALAAIKLSMGLGGIVLVLSCCLGSGCASRPGGLLSVEPTLFYRS
jgi:hypothetical protein